MKKTLFFLLLVGMVLSASVSNSLAAPRNPSPDLAAGYTLANGAVVPAALAKAERLMKEKFSSYSSAENWSACLNGFFKRYESPKGKNLYLLLRWDGVIAVTFGFFSDPTEQTVIGRWWPD